MRKFVRYAAALIISGYLYTLASAGIGVIATFLLRNVSGAGGWWNAWFLFGVFLVVMSVTLAGARFGVAELQRHGVFGATEPMPDAGDSNGRRLRVAAQAIRTELMTCKAQLEDALYLARHWDPERVALPAEAWRHDSNVLAGSPEWSTTYNACRRAYVALDRTNKDNERHWVNTRRNFYDPTPAEYREVVGLIDAAEGELARKLDE